MNSLTQNTQNTPESCTSMSVESDIRSSIAFSRRDSPSYHNAGAKLISLLNDQDSLKFEKTLSTLAGFDLTTVADPNSQTCI